jgi:hypothetical protein
MIPSNLGYYSLTGIEFVQSLGSARPRLVENWAESNACAQGDLRAVESGILPWEEKGQTIDVLAWPSGACMVSKRMADWLRSGT